ncbi:MAG: site-specific DNA-methyltransferase, partial [Blastopirellula sp.]
MKQVKPEDGQSTDIVAENIEHLKELFPEVFTEGGVNFDTLRQLLGDAKVLDEGEEKYGLNWHGKKKARQISLTPSTGTLLPCVEDSVDWNATKNLFIEGDNLEVLKLLQKSYANKVKMIYIDPPYNTGKEFVYPDNYKDNLDTYLRYTGQIDEDGIKFSSNTESSGRKHTNWLNMMYPRLKLARNLLKSDGCIFISIDDNEQSNLKKVCDEIFGEENFVANIVWQKKYSPQNDAKYFSDMHDHILLYAKSKEIWRPIPLPRTDEQNAAYKNPDNDPRGPWKATDSTCNKSRTERPNLYYPIVKPDGTEVLPLETRVWRYSRNVHEGKQKDNRVWWGKGGDNGTPAYKSFLSEVKDGRVPTTIWSYKDGGHNQLAKQELNALIPESPFQTPKPVKLIQLMASIAVKPNDGDIVLDFFAGSGTTGHAVMDLNFLDNGNRKFILVQIPEKTEEHSDAFKAGYSSISEIAKDRLRRFSVRAKNELEGSTCDLGYKAFKLTSSNIAVWNPDKADIEKSLLAHEEHLIEGRSEEDVLYELLLKRGVDLAVPIECRE